MKWIDFQCMVDEAGIEHNDEIDTIEKIGSRYDICYTTADGHATVASIPEDEY